MYNGHSNWIKATLTSDSSLWLWLCVLLWCPHCSLNEPFLGSKMNAIFYELWFPWSTLTWTLFSPRYHLLVPQCGQEVIVKGSSSVYSPTWVILQAVLGKGAEEGSQTSISSWMYKWSSFSSNSMHPDKELLLKLSLWCHSALSAHMCLDHQEVLTYLSHSTSFPVSGAFPLTILHLLKLFFSTKLF